MLKLLNFVYGNRLGQEALASIVRKCHRYMGVGTGDNVLTSGEQGVIKMMKSLRTPPYCLFDVGSHLGEYLGVALDLLAREEYRIHCFEPSGRLFGILSEKATGDGRVVLNNCGLGKEKGQVQLYYDAEEAGGSLTKRRLDHIGIDYSQSETVEIDTLDSYCEKNGIPYIHLLKMDIEGHELDLLLGARHMFETGAVKIATFEFGGCNIDTHTYFQDYFYYFKEMNMDLYRITPSGYLFPMKGYSEMEEQFKTTNFAAINKRS
jgi:FkbM family methyltransferase